MPRRLQSLTFGRDFNQSLEGVTLPDSLESLTLGDCFSRILGQEALPKSLQNLTFGDHFDHSLEHTTLPSSIQTLTFGDCFNCSLANVTLPNNLRILTFGFAFNQSLVGTKLPGSLKRLTFGTKFKQSLKSVHLPSMLECLTFGDYYNKSLEDVSLPESLQLLTFGDCFSQSLDHIALPKNLQSLTVGRQFNNGLILPNHLTSLTFCHRFNQILDGIAWPSSLESLTFGHDFNQSLIDITWPNRLQSNQSLKGVSMPRRLQSLTFGRDFNQSLEGVTLPDGLESLTLGDCFNCSLQQAALPKSLQSLTFGRDFNESLLGVTLPDSLERLSLGDCFNRSLQKAALPKSLQSLTFGRDFNQSLKVVTLPDGLKSLTLGDNFNQCLTEVSLPSSLESLTFGHDFNQSLEQEGLNSFSIDVMGERRRARLIDDTLVWNDGDVWTRDGRTRHSNMKPVDNYGDSELEAGTTMMPPVTAFCQKGLKPNSPNQDAWSVVRVEDDFSIYSVYDGHGPHGHDVANFVKDTLPRLLVAEPRLTTAADLREMFTETYRRMHLLIDSADAYDKLSARWSGCTSTTVVHHHQTGRLSLAHVGDSSAVLGGWDGAKSYAKQLTRDHKPQLKDEMARIVASGGLIDFDGFSDYRIYNKEGYGAGLNMTRSLGDLEAHRETGLIADPEVTEHQVGVHDRVLLLCSDGIWEFMTPEEAVDIVLKFSDPREAGQALLQEARHRWTLQAEYIDDIVALVIPLFTSKSPRRSPLSDRNSRDGSVLIEPSMSSRMLGALRFGSDAKDDTKEAEQFQVQLQELSDANDYLRRRLRLAEEEKGTKVSSPKDADSSSSSSEDSPKADEATTLALRKLSASSVAAAQEKAISELPKPTVEELWGQVHLILAKLQQALQSNPQLTKKQVQDLLKKFGDVVVEGRWKLQYILSCSTRVVVAVCKDELLNQDVVLKVGQSLEASQQLARVVYILRRLVDVSIAPNVYYFSSPTSSLPFMVMDLLQGYTLRSRFKSIADGEDDAIFELEAAELGYSLLTGMDACHQHQVFNLGLCPEHVWVGPDMDGSRVLILDWNNAEVGAASVSNPQIYAVGDMRRKGLLRGDGKPIFYASSTNSEVQPLDVWTCARKQRAAQTGGSLKNTGPLGTMSNLVLVGHGSLYYMSMEQLYCAIRSYEKDSGSKRPEQTWHQEPLGSRFGSSVDMGSWATGAWEEVRGSLPEQQEPSQTQNGGGPRSLRALTQGLLAQWPLAIRRPTANEDFAAPRPDEPDFAGPSFAQTWLSRLLPRAIASTLLQRQDEQRILQLGGEGGSQGSTVEPLEMAVEPAKTAAGGRFFAAKLPKISCLEQLNLQRKAQHIFTGLALAQIFLLFSEQTCILALGAGTLSLFLLQMGRWANDAVNVEFLRVFGQMMKEEERRPGQRGLEMEGWRAGDLLLLYCSAQFIARSNEVTRWS
eukprot:s8_g20.t2